MKPPRGGLHPGRAPPAGQAILAGSICKENLANFLETGASEPVAVRYQGFVGKLGVADATEF
jgi:hypothetical protein